MTVLQIDYPNTADYYSVDYDNVGTADDSSIIILHITASLTIIMTVLQATAQLTLWGGFG